VSAVTQPPRIPSVRAAGRGWSSDEIEAMASRWRFEILEGIGEGPRPVAGAVPATPEGVALLAALTSLPSPAILLAPDARAWRSVPPLPAGTLVALPPSLAHFAPVAEQLACVPRMLSDQHSSRARRGPSLIVLESPGVVLFTSGSSGTPRPVFRRMNALLAGVTARLEALGVESGDGIVAGVSLAHGYGLNTVLSSMVLGGPLGLLDPLDYRAALATLARLEFTSWSATAHFADVLSRCALTGPAIAPKICLVSGPISQAVFDAFRDRFGVPLRQNYSSSETGVIALDAAPPADVRPGTVGRPLAGVDVRIGNHPAEPSPPDEAGRVWVRSPWQMAGYGFPPAVERPGEVDGWWPTRDLGMLEPDGRLVLAGCIDDCIRTRDGRLVNLAIVASSLRTTGGVRDVAVVPVQSPAGASFGAVLECDSSVTLATLKERLSKALPPWAWPRDMVIVQSLPRLASGKPDRRSCSAMLRGHPSL
jgi:acyl-coenzyme A synthetase/AMP-(fatty) acid ligase